MTRADDGTYLRGRWGARSSGRGVGARTGQRYVGPEGHPFHRLEPVGGTQEEEVGKIDKACEARERTQPQRAENTGRQEVLNRTLRSMVIPETSGPSRTWLCFRSTL